LSQGLAHLDYSQIAGVASARPDGYRATLLVVHDGTRITVTSLDGPGALTELEHELRGRTEQPQSESATPSVSAA
jgi:hypothetical protein